jgi:hypothetical protein
MSRPPRASSTVAAPEPMPSAVAAGESRCDLVPEAIRERLAESSRRRRSLALGALLGLFGVGLAGLAEFDRAAAARRHSAALRAAAEAVSLLRAIDRLDTEIAGIAGTISASRAATAPVPVSGVVATLLASLPKGVTAETIEVDASYLRPTETRTKALKGAAAAAAPKGTMRGTLAGFAPDDAAVAEIVRRLEESPLVASVSLESARHRLVRGTAAREFRVSFEVREDLRALLADPHEVAGAGEYDHGG